MAKSRPERTLWYTQFLKLKAQHPDTVLLYRLGDFYEVFDDDAKLVAGLLNVTLTRKKCATNDKGEDVFAPMAGMPYHAVDNYIGKLVGAGYRVAVAEQMGLTDAQKRDTRPRSAYAPGEERGSERLHEKIEHREVVRVITPGTRTDPAMLPAGQNNYLAAVISSEQGGELRIGLAYADLTTGEFCASEFGGERAQIQLDGELARLGAAEILVPDDPALRPASLAPASSRLTSDLAPMTRHERAALLRHERVARKLDQANDAEWAHGHVTCLPAWRWEQRQAEEELLRQLKARSLAGFGLADKPLASRAAGAIVQYLRETQRSAVGQISTLRSYGVGTFMFLDPQTRRNLALTEGASGTSKGSLVKVLDQTRTPMGARLLRRWLNQPLLDPEQLRLRQDAVTRFVDDGMRRAEVREALRSIGDLERTVNRVVQGIAHPRDLANLRESLRAAPSLIALLAEAGTVDGRRQTADPRHQTPDAEQPTPDSWQPAPEPWQMQVADDASDGVDDAADPFALDDDDDLFGDLFGDAPSPSNKPGQKSPPGDKNRRRAAPEATTRSTALPAAKNRTSSAHTALPEPPVDPALAAAASVPAFEPEPATAAAQTPLDPCADICGLLDQALDDSIPALLGASDYLSADPDARRVVRQGYSSMMDRIIDLSRDAKAWLADFESRERERTGLKSLKVGYNKVFGYYIELPRNVADQVPAHYERRQTLVGSERYITEDMKKREEAVITAEQRLNELEREVFEQVCADISVQAGRLLALAAVLAEHDVCAALAEAAVRGRYVRPELRGDERIIIRGGRHPIVEQAIEHEFIANDTTLDTAENQLLIITGPNMAGKSTFLRQVALIVLMAQIGSFVPAEAATIGLVDRIFTRIGAQDDIATGQSTFMVEMTETAALLAQSTRRSLIILDEVGRGTSTYDGMAIARAVIEYIHNHPRLGCRTLFATHYHELTDLEQYLPRVKNYHVAAVEQDDQIVFLHEVRRGGADRSYGIHVAELAGIPRSVIARAKELLAELEGRPEARDRGPKTTDNRQLAPDNRRQTAAGRRQPDAGEPLASAAGQLSLFDVAPNPVVELLKRLQVEELTPIEALTKLYELKRLASEPRSES